MKVICWLFGHRWSDWRKRPKGVFVYGAEERECTRCKIIDIRFIWPRLAMDAAIQAKLPQRWVIRDGMAHTDKAPFQAEALCEPIMKRIPDPPPWSDSTEIILPVETISREEVQRRWPKSIAPPPADSVPAVLPEPPE